MIGRLLQTNVALLNQIRGDYIFEYIFILRCDNVNYCLHSDPSTKQIILSTVFQTLQKSLQKNQGAICLLNGVGRLEFEQAITSMFRQSQIQNQPGMNAEEFRKKLRTCALGLTQKDINLVMGHLRIKMDDIVTLQTVLPTTFDVLAQRHEHSLILREVPPSVLVCTCCR